LHLPDLNLKQTSLLVLIDVDVDGEMGVDVAHLVLESLCDTDDQIVDESADGAKRGDVLAAAVVDLDADDALLGHGEVDGKMAQVLGELAPRPLNRDQSRLDGDLDCTGIGVSACCPPAIAIFSRETAPSQSRPRIFQ